ncbi:MAG: type II toxin-antitoxin system VapC family toxin [Limisphaerales bacterium]
MLDSNVLLDIITADAKWLSWSTEQFRQAASDGAILINPVIYSELAPAFETQAGLDRWLKPSLFRRLPLSYEAAFRASEAFRIYRERGGTKTSALPDFYIGAQAEIEGLRLVTRDVARYRTYFKNAELVFPQGT